MFDSNHQERVLAHVAADIAGSPGSYEVLTPVKEVDIDPVILKRESILDELVTAPEAEQQPEGEVGTRRVVSKPPRPCSRPGSSPVDYDPYHNQEHDVIMDKTNVVRQSSPEFQPSISATQSDQAEGRVEPRLDREQVIRVPRPATSSLDRREPQSYSNGPTSMNVRRTQTMRVDYAERIRERVKSLRVTSHGSTEGMDGTLRYGTKPLSKRETYVCADTFKLPKFNFKLKKKRQSEPPKQVFSTPDEPVVRRPQPTIEPMISPSIQHSAVHMSAPVESYSVARHQSYPSQYTSPKPVSIHSSNRQLTSIPVKEELCTRTPYVSREIFTAALTNDVTLANEAAKLREVLPKVQPFLKNWTDASGPVEQKESELQECIKNYLNTCAKLRAVDLQGPFATFQYPLPSFNRSQWQMQAQLTDWNGLEILTDPEQQTEYVQLVPGKNLVYTSLPVDTLLANWLEHHGTDQEEPETYANIKSFPTTPMSDAFHPTLVTAGLDQLLKCGDPFDLDGKNELFRASLRIAVLLSYESCVGHPSEPRAEAALRFQPSAKSKDILLSLSTGNCLALFKKDAGEPQPEGTTAEHDLVSTLCPGQDTVTSAVKALIKEIHTLVTEKMSTASMVTPLLTAIAPPDWIAMLVARILLKPKP